jgi:hypothetical protein
MNSSSRKYARTAGVLYLVTHVTSVTAVAAYGTGLIAGGVMLEFALAIGCLGTGILLWILLRDVGPVRAATFALLRTIEASVIIAGALPMVAILWVGQGSWTTMLTTLHTAAFLLGQGLVISVNTVVLGWLLWDSRRVPRSLALLGIVGGVIVLVSNLAQLWGLVPLNGVIAGIAAVPIFAFEIWFAVRLISVGLRTNTIPTPGHGPQSAATASPSGAA